MKIRCDRKALLDKVTLASGVTASRGTRPILQHVLLTATKGSCELAATDLEMAIRCSFEPLEVEEEGAIALPAARLLGILRESRGETIDLGTDGQVGTLRASRSVFRVSGEHAEDFPELPAADEATFVDLPADVFRTLAERTQFAASRELGRYAINGILVEIEAEKARFVATDGRRLALAEAPLTTPAKETGREILPLKAVGQFLKSIGPEVETVGVSLSSRRTLLRAGSALLAATSVEAEFPDYGAVVGMEGDKRVVLDREALFTCIRQAAVMAGDDVRLITLAVSEGSLVVSSSAEGVGDARSEMGVDYVGDKTAMSFNPDFLLDFAKVNLPDQIPMSFQDESAAVMFRPAEDFLYVVMPINP